MPEVSIIMSAKDNVSNQMKTMQQNTKSFDKTVEYLQNRLKELNEKKVNVKVNMLDAQKEAKATEKAFKKLRDEESKISFKNAANQAAELKEEYKSLSYEISSVEKKLKEAYTGQSIKSNRASSKPNIAEQLGQAGAYSMLGDVLGQAAQVYAGSLLGNVGGSLFGSALSSAGQGAAIGSMIAPGIGTAVGAAAGAGLGLISGGINLAASEDERYKSWVQSTYEGIQAERQTQLTTGSGIAAGRETALNSFETLFGDRGIAETFIADMVEFANETPFLFDDLTSMAKVLATYGYQVEDIKGVIQDIGDAGAALGMGQEDMNMVATALGRMKSSGKTSLEYVNILQERGIDAIGYLAEDRGTSIAQVYEDISDSLIDGAEAAKVIQAAMREDFGENEELGIDGAMEKQSQTFSGLSSTVQGLQDEMANAMGAGYNETRSQGMKEQISFLSGSAAEQMQEAYKYIGQFQADLENKKEEYLRDAMTAVMEGTIGENFSAEMQKQLEELHAEYQKSITAAEGGDKEAQADLGAILAEAQAAAMAAYTEDEGENLRIDAEVKAIQGIQESGAVTKAYDGAGYALGIKMSEGLGRALKEKVPDTIEQEMAVYADNPIYGHDESPVKLTLPWSRAMGETRVPRDGTLYMLHEGEKVLTASQARAYDNSGGAAPFEDMGDLMGMPFEMERTTTTTVTDWPTVTPGTSGGASAGTGGVNVTVTGNEFIVRSESDIDAIAQAIAKNLAQAQMVT